MICFNRHPQFNEDDDLLRSVSLTRNIYLSAFRRGDLKSSHKNRHNTNAVYWRLFLFWRKIIEKPTTYNDMLNKLLPVVFVMILGGCYAIPTINGKMLTVPYPTTTSVDSHLPNFICWSENSFSPHARELWLIEARKRFANPIVFSCHGGYEFVEKRIGDDIVTTLEWWLYPDSPRKPIPAQSAADTLANMYPDRDIVFLPCNPNGFELHTKRVFYAKQATWIIPDDYQSWLPIVQHESKRDFDTVGSIWEFVGYDGHDGEPTKIVDRHPTHSPATKKSTIQP